MQRIRRGDLDPTYSQVLRVIGAYIDRANLSDIRIVETDEGMIVQGRITRGPRAGEQDTYQLTPEDVEGLVRDARAQRGKRL